MLHHLLRYLKHHHLALLALFVASGGVSYAAAELPANSVTTRQVKDHSLLRRDFKRGQLLRGPPGPAWNPGPHDGRGWWKCDESAAAAGQTLGEPQS